MERSANATHLSIKQVGSPQLSTLGTRTAMLRSQIRPKPRECRKAVLAAATLGLLLTVVPGRPPAAAETPPTVATDFVPGTTITAQNWANYGQYMSEGLVALFEGRQFWRKPADIQIAVGPSISTPLPKKYQDDTAKYADSVRLVKTPDGGYVPVGYVAGLPFPHPLDGERSLIGQRVFWDSYYRYQPRVQAAPNFTYSLDRFGNMTQNSEDRTVISQLAFLSDIGMPQTIADSGGYYAVKYYQEIAPEQDKYSTVLDLAPADPTKLDELYEYVPSLRRLSQAARCAPLFGSDYLIDDENYGPPGLPQLFQIDYLGARKILVLAHANPAGFELPGGPAQLDPNYYYPGALALTPFPKPMLGNWELRDTYALSLRRLAHAAAGYCYSRRVMYVDQQNYFGAGAVDLYDPSGRLFKAQFVFLYPVAIPGTDGDVADLVAGPSVGFLVNFLDKHVTASVGLAACLNTTCARGGYLDIHRYASPDALARIVQ